MILKNQEIYNYASKLAQIFGDGNIKLPIKVNFYLHKNKKILNDLAQEIELSRLEIAKKYGILNEEKQTYEIPLENTAQATQELEELFNIEQDISLSLINLSDLNESLVLTTLEMDALMFMIEE